MVLIGSQALRYYENSNLLIRKPRDYDLISTFDEFQEWVSKKKVKSISPIKQGKKIIVKKERTVLVDDIFEFELSWSDSVIRELETLVKEDKNTIKDYPPSLFPDLHIPSLDVLYTIKLSHKYLKDSPYFLKTMNDIKAMEKLGCKIPDEYKSWFKKREKETYYYSHPNLKQDKANFFNPEQVKYVYEHDTIHIAMAHLDKPAYSYFKKNEADVEVSKEKFLSAPEIVKLYSVLEESYVLAIERSQVPFKGKLTPKQSFLKALEKVCTSISSGWWREYAYNNYFNVLDLYNDSYIDKFWGAVEKGIVKKID